MKIPICLIFPFVLLFPHARAENPDDFSPERKTCILHLRSVRDSLQKDIDSKRLRINAILFTEGIAELTVADQPYIRLPFPCLGYDDLDDYVRAVDSLQTFDRSYYPAAQRRRTVSFPSPAVTGPFRTKRTRWNSYSKRPCSGRCMQIFGRTGGR